MKKIASLLLLIVVLLTLIGCNSNKLEKMLMVLIFQTIKRNIVCSAVICIMAQVTFQRLMKTNSK